MKRLIGGIVFTILALACATAHAASYTVDGKRLILSGGLYDDHEFATFARKLKDNPHVDTIVLKDFGGGMISIGSFMTIPNTIREKKLATEIDGPCVGNCALAFIAGVRRGLAPGADPKQAFVGFRGIISNGQPAKEFKPSFVRAVQRFTGGRMTAEIAGRAYDLPRGGMLIFLDPRAHKRGEATAFMCDSFQPEKNCVEFPSVDIFKAGIFTR